MSAKLSPNDAKWVAEARAQFIEKIDGKEIAALKVALAAKDAEIARLTEKVEILEAEIRVMRKLPSAIGAALGLPQQRSDGE